MARIVIDARFYGTEHTGLGRYTTNVISHLPQLLPKHELFILLRSKYYHSLSFPANCTKVLCEVTHYTFKEQLVLPVILQRLRADLLYTFHFNTPVFAQIPKVVTVHDLIKSYFAEKDTTTHSPLIFKLKRLGYTYAIKKAVNQASAIITPTNTVKNQLLANFGTLKPEKIIPIPEAPDPIFVRSKPNGVDLKINLPDKFLLYVGNAYPHKNLSLLLNAYRNLKIDDLKLVIVSAHTPFLARTLAPFEPRNIQVLSSLTDQQLLTVYQRAQALITPSLMEGYGLVGLEALMVGTRVIASDIPVYHEVFRDLVTYFDPKSVTGLVKAINKSLALPSPPILRYNRSWQQVAQSIAEVISENCPSL